MDKQLPLISFVVPCYNYARFLAECLESILGQEGGFESEVIAIDDGSNDNTQEILRSFRDARLSVITHKHNQGHIATVTEGLLKAKGEFISRIDPDDRLRPYFLKETVDKFYRYPEVALVYGDAAHINEQGQVMSVHTRAFSVHGGRDYKGSDFIKLLEDNFICSPTVIARSSAWKKALPVPSGLAFHDWYFNLMIAREHDVYYIDKPLAEYRIHADNHHSLAVRDKTIEPSIFWLLDSIFSQKEKDNRLQQEKMRSKGRIYASQYFNLANIYFGFSMLGDARRCYLRVLRYSPRYIFKAGLLRYLAATFIGLKAYNILKAGLKKKDNPTCLQ